MALFLQYIYFVLMINGEPWFSIPLKLTTNNEHFVSKMSFGKPIKFSLDIIMDTGSGSFHIYRHAQNNLTKYDITPYDTESFECICQIIDYSLNSPQSSYLIDINDTWYQYKEFDINNESNYEYKSYLDGCPLFNETTCNEWGELCKFDNVWIYRDDINDKDEQCALNETLCIGQVCAAKGSYGLLINGETATFKCDNNCYSGIDIIKFDDIDYIDYINNDNYIPYIYADTIIIDSKDHNISLFKNESWSDGVLGLVYDYHQQTSFWQILGIKEEHSVLIAFDSLKGFIDIGNISKEYESLIDYSENIWWNATYHYFYIYQLSICNIDIFDILNIGSYYLAMIDTGATCLTLPPEIFDLLFKYIPYSFICNGNQTFCYISNEIKNDDLNKFDSFPMLSFKLNENDNNNNNVFYVSLKDLIIELSNDKEIKYCIERGKHSINDISECTPNPKKQQGSHDCTGNGIIIFGTKVLQSLYTILDYPNKRVGFANNLISNYTNIEYNIANNQNCKLMNDKLCIGNDIFNYTLNKCQSGKLQCEKYWGWTYNKDTHFCVLQTWLYSIIPIIWILIIILLFLFIKFKLWIDKNIYYTAIKV